jgi:ActR/RegA family two-component response regulator
MFSSTLVPPRHATDGSIADKMKPITHSEELLLVDDDAPLRRSLSRALERRGFDVLQAETFKEARMWSNGDTPLARP